MKDSEMANILRNFASAGSGDATLTNPTTGKTTTNPAMAEKNAMKALLEGLDAAQKSVNQMPATHKMAKATGTKHPASNFLVGGEEGEPEEGEEVVAEVAVEEDTVAKKDSSAMGDLLKGVGDKAGGSLGDIFKALADKEEEGKRNIEREFHTGIKKEKELKKADNGKYELDEESGLGIKGDMLVESIVTRIKSYALDNSRTQPDAINLILNEVRRRLGVVEEASASIGSAANKAEKRRQVAINKAKRAIARGMSVEKAAQEYDLLPGDLKKLSEADEAPHRPGMFQQKTIDKLTNAGGKVVGRYKNDKGEVAVVGQNGKRWFVIRPDGSHMSGSGKVPGQVNDTEYRTAWAKPAEPKKEKKERVNYHVLANYINDAVGFSIPDGDPIDYLMSKGVLRRLESLGLDPMTELDKAAKKYLGAKDYYDFLADAWDSYASTQGDAGEQNPWR